MRLPPEHNIDNTKGRVLRNGRFVVDQLNIVLQFNRDIGNVFKLIIFVKLFPVSLWFI